MELERKILIIEDDKALSITLTDILKDKGYQVQIAENYETAQPYLASAQLVIVDLRLPDKPGMELLKELKETNPEAEVIIVTGYADVQTAIDACNLGAFAYLKKPVTPDRLLLFLKRAVEKQQLAREVKRREQEITGLTGFTGTILNERINLLEEAKQREERLSRLYRGIDLSFRASNPLEAGRQLLPLIAEETRANNAALNVIGTDGKVIDRVNYFEGMEPFKARSRAGGTRDEVLRTKKPVIIPDMAKYPGPNPDARDAGIQSMCTYPLIVDDIVCGTLFLASLSKDGFTGMEQIITPFVDLCAIPLRQSIIHMETDRARKTWEATINLLNVGIVITDQDGNIIQTNKYLSGMVKVPVENLPGKKLCTLIHGYPEPVSDCQMEKVCKSGESAAIVIKEDFLNIKRLQIRLAPIKNGRGEITHFVHTFHNLDSREKDKS